MKAIEESFNSIDLSEEEDNNWTKENTAKAMDVQRKNQVERRKTRKNQKS